MMKKSSGFRTSAMAATKGAVLQRSRAAMPSPQIAMACSNLSSTSDSKQSMSLIDSLRVNSLKKAEACAPRMSAAKPMPMMEKKQEESRKKKKSAMTWKAEKEKKRVVCDEDDEDEDEGHEEEEKVSYAATASTSLTSGKAADHTFFDDLLNS
jgi:hypothetical protein